MFIWLSTHIFLYNVYKRNNIDIGKQYAYNQLYSYVVYTFAVIIAFQFIGINMTLIWGGAAALLVGIGIALQQTINDFFCGITFPVKDQFCSLIVGGWGGPVVGLSCIDGKDASENATNVLKRFDKNVWYKIKMRVTGEKIQAWIDDEKLVDFAYTGHELYVRPEVELSKPFGICTWMTTGELRRIRLEDIPEN